MPNAPPGWSWVEPETSTLVNLWATNRATDAVEAELQRNENLDLRDIPNPATWLTVKTGLAPGAGGQTTFRGKAGVNQNKYSDDTAQPGKAYKYRLRYTEAGGANPTAWDESYNTVVMPPDDIFPAKVRDLIPTQPPNCQGTIHTPANAAELKTLLDTVAFSRGDIIELDHTVDYGPEIFNFPKLTDPLTGNRDQDFVLVRSDAWQSLPDVDERVHPGDADNMPKCFANGNTVGVFNILKGANYYYFLGIHFDRGNPPAPRSNGLFDMYQASNTDFDNEERDAMNEWIIVDRCYFFGGAETEAQAMAVLLQGKYVAVINCYMENMKQTGETQCILIWVSYGPVLVQNNWLASGSTMNIMSGPGGRGPGSNGADTLITRNVMGTLPKYDERSFSFDFDSAPGTPLSWTDIQIDGSDATKILRPTDTAGAFTIGESYTIVTAGTTDFTLVGASNSNPGTDFIATGIGSGTGTAARNFNSMTHMMCIRINSGTGFVPGVYRVIAMDSTTNPAQMYLNRAVGTTGSTGGNGSRPEGWSIKNTYESKNSERIEISENIFLGCPEVGQPGYKLFFGPRAAGAGGEFAWVKSANDVTVRWNHFTNNAGYIGMQIDSTQDTTSDTTTLGGRRVLFENNLLEDTLDFNEALFQPAVGSSWPSWPGLTIRHNTFVARVNPSVSAAPVNPGTVTSQGAFSFIGPGVKWATGSLIGNVFTIGQWGSRSVSGGSNDLAASLSGALDPSVEHRDNVWIDVDNRTPGIPVNDVSAATFDDVFIDWRGKDFRIKPAFQGIVSPPVLRGQINPGCDIDELQRRLQGVFSGRKPKRALVLV